MKLKIKKEGYLLIGGVVTGIILIGYLVLCSIASGKDFLANTAINGIDVSNMTKQEAINALEKQFANDTKNNTLNVTLKDKKYQVDVKDNISFDCKNEVEKIYDQLNGSFFIKGYYYLFNDDYTIGITIKDKKKLTEAIANSKILEYNTVVKTTYEIKDNQIIFTKGKAGEIVESNDVVYAIKTALENYDFNIDCPTTEAKLDKDEMTKLHETLSKGAKNATLDKHNNYQIIEGEVGVKFSLEAAISAYDKADEGDTFKLDATITQPKITSETLKQNLFKDVLGEYTTSVGGSSVRKNNVKLAGQKCNNVILLPGETFSYNGTVGKRTKANGFGEAGAYSNGESVMEVGGGICQTSSTLYNAVLLSNLQIVERRNHTFISSYVPIGRDATVSWGGPDFKFKNNTDYPIKIAVSYANSRITTKIYGTNVNNYQVVIKSQRTGTIPYTTTYENDPTLLEGQTQVKQAGSNGAKAVSYRYVYDANGKLISSKQEANSVYKPHNEIILRGTKKAPVQPTTPETPETPIEPTVPTN